MAIIRVQGPARAYGSGANTSLSITMSSAPTNGNVLILTFVSCTNASNPIVASISQTGVTWTKQKQYNYGANSEIWLGVVGNGASVNITVNITTYGGTGSEVADVCEYSGIATSPLDQTQQNYDSGTIHSTGTTPITTQADELWIGLCGPYLATSFTTSTPQSGFTLLDGAYYFYTRYGVANCFLEKIVNEIGTAQTGVTTSVSVGSTNCIATFKAAAGGPIAKSFSDSGAGSDGFINPYRAMPFSDAGHGAEAFNTPFRSMGFADVGAGAEAFNTPFRTMGFAENGHGVDAFLNSYRAMGFSEVGHGTDTFLILFKGLGFSDSGHGADSFSKFITFLNQVFADSGHGADVFVIPFKALGFTDVGHGADLFVLLRMLAFSDSGLGSDSFAILFKAFKFSDVGYGVDAFNIPFRAMKFSDVGYASDVFAVMFKALGFVDVGSGVDTFTLLRALAFTDLGHGTDAFQILFKAMQFSDLGLGSDSFSKEILGFLLKAFSDAGLGSDAFNTPFRTMKFQDSGLGADVWRGANLIEAPLVIVTADGKIILRISRATKKEPDYIMLG